MFDDTSRYADLDELSSVDVDGRTVVYKARRLLLFDDEPSLMEVEVAPMDRPDLLSARTIGRPELYWRVCDANGVMDPLELTARPGRTIRIPMQGT